MVDLLIQFHKGMGHLLSGLAIVAIIWTVVLAMREGEDDTISTVAMKSVVGLVDLQILLGIILYSVSNFQVGAWHPVLGILAAISYHAGAKMKSWKRVGGFVAGFACLLGAYLVVVAA